MAYSPPTRSLNFLIHGSRAHDLVPLPPHIEIVLFTEHDEALTGGQASLVFSWLRKNYEQGAANVLLQPVFIQTPQRRYRIGGAPQIAAAAAAAAAGGAGGAAGGWNFRQGGGGYSGGIGSLVAQPVAAPAGGAAAAEPLLDTVQPSQPQQAAADQAAEFSVTLSVYSHTVGRNMCPNIIFTFEDDFQVNPAFPTSMLGIYNTEAARLHYFSEGMPAAKSGRDLALTEKIYSRYGLGGFDLNTLLYDIFQRSEGAGKTRIYLCCCSGSIFAPNAPGSILHHGNLPGIPSSPLVNNISANGVRLKGIQKAIKAFKNAQASRNEGATRAAHTTLSQMIGLQ